MFKLAKRTTSSEQSIFHYLRNDRFAQRQARRLAEEAWKEWAQTNPDSSESPDFHRGFIEGFADYFYRGGSAEPPMIPPRRYWNPPFQNAAGRTLIDDWYEGFRQGAQDCKSRGLRDLVTVPTPRQYKEAQTKTDVALPVGAEGSQSLDLPLEGPLLVPIDAIPATDAAAAASQQEISNPVAVPELERTPEQIVDEVSTLLSMPDLQPPPTTDQRETGSSVAREVVSNDGPVSTRPRTPQVQLAAREVPSETTERAAAGDHSEKSPRSRTPKRNILRQRPRDTSHAAAEPLRLVFEEEANTADPGSWATTESSSSEEVLKEFDEQPLPPELPTVTRPTTTELESAQPVDLEPVFESRGPLRFASEPIAEVIPPDEFSAREPAWRPDTNGAAEQPQRIRVVADQAASGRAVDEAGPPPPPLRITQESPIKEQPQPSPKKVAERSTAPLRIVADAPNSQPRGSTIQWRTRED